MRSLSIFGIILFAAVGTNAMSMEKTHNKQQKFLRADASVQDDNLNAYLAGEISAGIGDPTGNGAASVKLVAKVGVSAVRTKIKAPVAGSATYSLAVSGHVSIGLECLLCGGAAGKFKVQLSYGLEIKIPIPERVASGCPAIWVAYTLAYIVEGYVANKIAATPATGSWWDTAMSFAQNMANWGFRNEVQLLMVAWGCDKHEIAYTSKIKLDVGTADTSVLQLMMGDKAEGKGVANAAGTQCTVRTTEHFTFKGLAVKPLNDLVKATFKMKTPTTGSPPALPEVSFQVQFRVIGETKPPAPKQELIGGVMKPIETKFFDFFKSWGADTSTNEDDISKPYLTALKGLFEAADKIFDSEAVKQIPFLGTIVDGMKKGVQGTANAVQAGVAAAHVKTQVDTKARLGVDFGCKYTYDKNKATGAGDAISDAFLKLGGTKCKIAFLTSIQKDLRCDVKAGFHEFGFKGVLGFEVSQDFEF